MDSKVRLWDTAALPGARPVELRREGSWYLAAASFHPAGNLLVAPTHGMSRLTFWPVPQHPPVVIDGYQVNRRPIAFSPDSKLLATGWGDGQLRLWPLPGSGSAEVRVLDPPKLGVWNRLAFDPRGRYLFAVGSQDNAWIIPLDGSPGRKLDEYEKDTGLYAADVSPTGRRVATAFGLGKGPKTLRVWEVDTGKVRLFQLPVPSPPSGSSPRAVTGYEGGVIDLAFLDDSTLFSAGDGGIRRWNLETGKHDLIRSVTGLGRLSMSSGRDELLFCEGGGRPRFAVFTCGVIELSTGAVRSLGTSADTPRISSPPNLFGFVTTQGPAFALLARDGSVLVGLRSGGEPHRLIGHAGTPNMAAISPDLRWVASTGEDNTLRLWPMPDLSKPPLHTLPHNELVARLKSLTNLRAVRDPASATG